MSVNRTQARNLTFNWGGHAASLFVLFFLSPFVVRELDATTFGIWSLLNVLAGYMGIFDLGVRASVGRHVALYLGKKDSKGVDETIRAGLAFFSLVGVLFLVVGILLGWLFPHVFRKLPEIHYGTVRMLLPVMAINVWLSALATIYSSILTAQDRFDLTRLVDLAALAVRTSGTVLALIYGADLMGLAAAVSVGNLVALGGNCFFAYRKYRLLKSWPLFFNRSRFKEIMGYGLAAFVSSAAVKIIGQSDLVIAGAIFNVAAVREYSVGAMLVYYSSTFIMLIQRTLFPSIQRAVGQGDTETVRWLYLRQIRIAMIFGIPMFVGMTAFANPFIRLWMLQKGFGEESVAISAGVMSILALSKLPMIFIGGAINILNAIGFVRVSAAMAITEAFTNLALSLIFTLKLELGLYGIAAGTLLSRLLIRTIWLPLIACRKTGTTLWDFSIRLVIPTVLSAFIFAGFCYFFLWLVPPATWTTFFGNICSVLLLYILVIVPFLLPKELRERLFLRLQNNPLIVFGKKG